MVAREASLIWLLRAQARGKGQLRLGEDVLEAGEGLERAEADGALDVTEVALAFHVFCREVAVEDADRSALRPELAVAQARRGRVGEDGVDPAGLELLLDQRADLQILGVGGGEDEGHGAAIGELAEPLDQALDHHRRVRERGGTGGAGEPGERERLVVATGAIGVHLAGAEGAVLAEEEVDAEEAGVVAHLARGAGETEHVGVQLVARALERLAVRERGDLGDGADGGLGGDHGGAVDLGREDDGDARPPGACPRPTRPRGDSPARGSARARGAPADPPR